MNQIIIKEIDYDSDDYQKLLDFRFLNLRKPLDLKWSEVDLKNENTQIHFSASHKDEIIGSILIKYIDRKIVKLRQMAVKENYRKKGIGTKLLKFAESYCSKKNFNFIEITARAYAEDFYKKNGYTSYGKYFTDVTLKSIKMKKNL